MTVYEKAGELLHASSLQAKEKEAMKHFQLARALQGGNDDDIGVDDVFGCTFEEFIELVRDCDFPDDRNTEEEIEDGDLGDLLLDDPFKGNVDDRF